MVALESVELFRNLRPAELKALRAVTLDRAFAAGQEIFREGAPGDGVYVVKEGLVEISGLFNRTTRRTFSKLSPGEVFGEMAVIEHRPRSATATAAQDAAVYFIPRGEMLGLMERSPGLSLSLLQLISHRLREFNQQYLNEVVQAEALAVIGRFARGVVHDLKNPLNIIGLTAELAGRPDATPQFRAQAQERIAQQVERISSLVSEILYFTQRAGEAVALAPMSYAEFIGKTVAELRPDAEMRGATLELENAPPASMLMLNPKRLTRVLFNLVHNATDAMPSGGKIIFRFGQMPREVVTEIEDTGPGIAPEILDRLFETFATHGKEHSTGLGLSICKKIVEDHGGRIWARNEPGRGAIFSFTIPAPKKPLTG
jgi:signal transduction histidine kinase